MPESATHVMPERATIQVVELDQKPDVIGRSTDQAKVSDVMQQDRHQDKMQGDMAGKRGREAAVRT